MVFDKARKVKKRLGKLRKRLPVKKMEIDDMKWVIFSDVHKGSGDGADDFKRAADNFMIAMRYYLKNGYTLVLLGDIEELWENRFPEVYARYLETYEIEKKFFDLGTKKKPRYYRIWGNHDDLWEKPKSVKQHLRSLIGPVDIHEGMRWTIMRKNRKLGELFLAHGHQGSLTSDTLHGISRIFVRYLWRPIQRTFKLQVNSLSKKYEAKSEHEKSMHRWANSVAGLILITGHTHHPVFMSESHEYILFKKMKSIERKIKKEKDKRLIKQMRKDLKKISKKLDKKLKEVGGHPFYKDKDTKPCYFNSGCCIFKDGDLTALEIGECEGERKYPEIRLVKWDENIWDEDEKRVTLQKHNLLHIFKACK